MHRKVRGRDIQITDAMVNYAEGLRRFTGLTLEEQLETEAVKNWAAAMAKRKAQRRTVAKTN